MDNVYETENNQNYNRNEVSEDQEYDENVKNNFEMSIASLGDIYSKTSLPQRNFLLSGNSKLHGTNSNKRQTNFQTPNQDNTLEILKLKSAKLGENNRFSHVKMGVINPVKHTNSIKPIYEKVKDNYEKKVSKIVLFASKVDIPSTKYPSINTKSKSRTRENNDNNNNNNNNNKNVEMVAYEYSHNDDVSPDASMSSIDNIHHHTNTNTNLYKLILTLLDFLLQVFLVITNHKPLFG